MFQLLQAQRELDDARLAWSVSHSAAHRMAFDRAVRKFSIAEARLNPSILDLHVQAA